MQEIITYIIISGAVAYTLYKLYREFISPKSKASCGGGCSQCSSKNDLIAEVKNRKKIAFETVTLVK